MTSSAQPLPRLPQALAERLGGLVPRTLGVDQLSRLLFDLCRRQGLSESQLSALLGPDSGIKVERTRRVLTQVLSGVRPDDLAALLSLASQFEAAFAVPLHPERVVSPAVRLGRRLAHAFGESLALACLYLVIGGLLAGESKAFSSVPGPLALLAFLTALAFLGLFEAMHTAATQLRLMDLGALSQSHPRAWALHARLRDEAGINRFLAGRQIVVVITVFFVAALSAFPTMEYLPFTAVAVPAVLRPLIELGIPGALVVLWLAQLAPQFYATRNALQLMNTRAAAAALRIAFSLQALGIASSVEWLIDSDSKSKRIPISHSLRWLQGAEEIYGDATLSVVRHLDCDRSSSTLSATSSTSVRRSGNLAVLDSTLLLPGAPHRLRIDSELVGAQGGERALSPTEYEAEPWGAGQRRLVKVLRPAIGSFQAGESARLRLEADYEESLSRDVLLVERPARFLI
jgi:hypothetical protein